jgi:hypothetical protein
MSLLNSLRDPCKKKRRKFIDNRIGGGTELFTERLIFCILVNESSLHKNSISTEHLQSHLLSFQVPKHNLLSHQLNQPTLWKESIVHRSLPFFNLSWFVNAGHSLLTRSMIVIWWTWIWTRSYHIITFWHLPFLVTEKLDRFRVLLQTENR